MAESTAEHSFIKKQLTDSMHSPSKPNHILHRTRKKKSRISYRRTKDPQLAKAILSGKKQCWKYCNTLFQSKL